MKISFILSSLYLSGGVRVIIEYANRLSSRGYSISLIAPGQSLDPDIGQELDSSVSVYQSKVSRSSSNSLVNKLTLAWSLSRAVPPSDIIFSTHTPTIPSAWLAARVWQKAKWYWLYQDYLEMFEGRKVEQELLQKGARWHDKIFTISAWCREELERFTQKEIIVTGEGLSHADLFYPRPRPPAGSPKTLLFLGDMRPRKGLQDFLAAAEIIHQNVPNLELWIVSKDHCVIETSLPYRYIYRPSRNDLAELYAGCDLFVSASWWESFGLPPLEAMACGAVVVLTDSRGVREYGRHEFNCLMVPPRSPEALAEAIRRVITDPALAETLRRNGPATARQFTWQAAIDRFEQALLN